MTDAALTHLAAGVQTAMGRIGGGAISVLERLSGGANMESWAFICDDAGYVLRRAPSAAMMDGRPFGHETEAALVRAAHAHGVLAPEVVVELAPGDGIGTGYIMRRVVGDVNPALILHAPPPTLIEDIAREMAHIHALPLSAVPTAIPTMDTAAALADLTARFMTYGGDRPIIALALRWLADHLPPPVPPALVHGDLRMGNIMVGADGLAAVLDWELAHRGDAHEDLAYGCMTVWRFGQIDRPAFGVADLEQYFAAYESAGGGPVDRARFDFWLVYRTTWWALGCLQMGAFWRDGVDRSLERVVIARRTSENELDLLMLLDHLAPASEQARALPASVPPAAARSGEPSSAEMIDAVHEWLGSAIKPTATGHDKFMVAVAMNALGIVRRDLTAPVVAEDTALAAALLDGTTPLATPGLLARLRRSALDKLTNDSPKYAALAKARRLWDTQTH